MDDVREALRAQQGLFDGLLTSLSPGQWDLPSRCEGWSVADVVVHMAQTNELAVASIDGRLADGAVALGWLPSEGDTVDDLAERAVVAERSSTGEAVGERWRASAAAMQAGFDACGPSSRVQWVSGLLSARTLATTRLSETWIHTGDIAAAVGSDAHTVPEGLPLIARLAWRTLPYAFTRSGRTLAGPVAVRLGSLTFEPDEPAVTTVEGDLVDWCLVAARRADPAATSLRASGPDAEAVLELVRTYA